MDFLKYHHNRHLSSATSNRSVSDADSQLDEFHSPLRANSPHLSDSIITDNHTPYRSPLSNNVAPLAKSKSPAGNFNRPVREDVVVAVAGSRKWAMVEKVGLGFRVCEAVFSLIAFSVMVSDKTQGWSGDSFYRYKEYRYLVAVNVIAFAYAAFQAIDLTYHLVYKRHIVLYSLRSHFDFLIDQILAYLLISSSSSAVTRINDWVLNWGSDEFIKKASASTVMSFLAFLGFAFSSLISGYDLCNQNPI
uniref:CASP-like protein 4A3 n=1 Tax=Erigeron canadensis TaxID=72917 RepID=UPI001CB89094|nr:CASP-like protein 4A3 [Erigeron canadensis]